LGVGAALDAAMGHVPAGRHFEGVPARDTGRSRADFPNFQGDLAAGTSSWKQVLYYSGELLLVVVLPLCATAITIAVLVFFEIVSWMMHHLGELATSQDMILAAIGLIFLCCSVSAIIAELRMFLTCLAIRFVDGAAPLFGRHLGALPGAWEPYSLSVLLTIRKVGVANAIQQDLDGTRLMTPFYLWLLGIRFEADGTLALPGYLPEY